MTLRQAKPSVSTAFPFESVGFDGNELRLIAIDVAGGELIIHTDAGTPGTGLKLKVKNARGNATTGWNANTLISNEYVDVTTVGKGAVIISGFRHRHPEYRGCAGSW